MCAGCPSLSLAVFGPLGEFITLRGFYGPGLGDGTGCVGLAFGDEGVVTGSLVVEEPVFVWSTVRLVLPKKAHANAMAMMSASTIPHDDA